jgi:hypothetical protein
MTKRIALLALSLCLITSAQTVATAPAVTAPVAVADIVLPTYIVGGAVFNQLAIPRFSGFLAGLWPVSDKIGLYTSGVADVTPVKYVDPATGRTSYLLSTSARAGLHKVVHNDTKNMVLLGADGGAAFSSGASASVTVGFSASFTASYVRQLSPHWAVAVPIRMLWVAGVGPGGKGAFNPVGEIGVVWKP